MAATDAYRPIDEPRPSGLAHLTVSPIWPLFASMFAGAWLSWPWFVLNAFAFGSPTRWREAALAVAGLFVTVGLLIAIIAAAGMGVLPKAGIPYVIILLTVWKLGVSYVLFTWQGPGFAIHEHFGGPARNGILLVFLGGFARASLAAALHPLVMLVIA